MPTISFYTPGDGQVHTLLDKVANSAGNIIALWRVTILNSAYDLDGNSVTPALVLVGDDVSVFPPGAERLSHHGYDEPRAGLLP